MDPYSILATLAGVFLFVHFAAIPCAEAQLRRSIGLKIIVRMALLSTLHLARTFALFATLSAALTVAAIWTIGRTGGRSVAAVTSTLEWLRMARSATLQVDPQLAIGSMILLAVAMVLMARRQAKINAVAAYNEAISTEVDRVLDDGRNGRWPDLAPTAAMVAIAKEIAAREEERLAADAERATLTSDDEADLEDAAHRERQVAAERLRQRIELIDKRLMQLRQALLREDVERRMDVRFDPTSLVPRAPETWTGRLATLIVSRGVLRSLRGLSRVAFLASIVLLIPSMLAIAAPSIDTALTSQIDAVEQLRVELDQKDAIAAVEQLKQAEPQPQPTTASPPQPVVADATILDTLARQYELSLGRHYQRVLEWHDPERGDSIVDAVRRDRVSGDIIDVDAHRVAVQVSAVSTADQRMADLEVAARGTAGPVTPAGREFRNVLDRDIRQGMPRRWDALRQAASHALADFHSMPTPGELRGMMLSSIIHSGADGLSPGLGQLVAGIDPHWLEQARLAQTAHLTEALATGRPIRTAFDDLADVHWHVPLPDTALAQLRTVAPRVPTEGDILRRAQDYHSNYMPKTVNMGDVQQAAARYLAAAYRDGDPHEAMEALFGFNDHFPGSMPPAPPAPVGGPSGGGLSGGGGGGGSAGAGEAESRAVRSGSAVAEEAVSLERVALSRSFAGLSGFSRIGGVLIGRSPDSRPGLDMTSLDWKRDGEAVQLTLRSHDGRDVVLGPFRPEIVHLALAYAADGRPVTATMVTASPLHELKILLHPALEDTAMGCRAIEVDRLVDRFAGSSEDNQPPSPREIESQRVYAYLELYRWAWAVTITAAAESDDPNANPSASRVLNALKEDAADYLDDLGKAPDSDTAKLLTLALQEREHLQDPQYSPLAVKPNFFAPEQVHRLAACAKDTLDETRACLKSDVATLVGQPGEAPRLDWTAPPPSFTVWSGVREIGFNGDPDLSFANARRPPQPDTPFAPLSFILQIAFTSKPILADPKSPWYEIDRRELDGVSDDHPWQFPRLQAWIDHEVMAGIKAEPDAQDTFDAVREFTAAQRLFRLALNGGLGPHFPLDRLTALAEASQTWVRSGVRTPRWNPRPGVLEAEALEVAWRLSALDTAPANLREAAASCVKAYRPSLDTLAGRVQLAAISPAEWDKFCPIAETAQSPLDPGMRAAVQRFAQVSAARDLRQKLGVSTDDRALLSMRTQTCAPF